MRTRGVRSGVSGSGRGPGDKSLTKELHIRGFCNTVQRRVAQVTSRQDGMRHRLKQFSQLTLLVEVWVPLVWGRGCHHQELK